MRTLVLFMLSVPVFSALADLPKDMPQRKHGLWDITMEHQGGHKMTMQTCVGPGTDSVNYQAGEKMSQKHCSKNTVTRQGGKIVAESVCRHGGSTIITRAVFTGDFGSGYRADIHSRYEPPMAGLKESKQAISARWTGPCKPGQKPGDTSMPGMGGRGPVNINMKDMMERMRR